MPQGKPDAKVLGLVWNTKDDLLKYKVEVEMCETQQPKSTKRKILSQVARIYDPIDLAAPYLVSAKISLQDVWQKRFDWDDELSPSEQTKWSAYFKEMEQLSQTSVERCLYPEIATDCSAMEFIQTLRRFFSIHEHPAEILSNNGTQFVALTELRQMTQRAHKRVLKDYCAERGVQWKFITQQCPFRTDAWREVKSCKLALKKAVGEHVLTPLVFELFNHALNHCRSFSKININVL